MAEPWQVVSVAPAAPPQWDVASVEPIPFSAMKMLGNAPGSFKKNVIDGLVEAISSPVQTAKGIADVAAGRPRAAIVKWLAKTFLYPAVQQYAGGAGVITEWQ